MTKSSLKLCLIHESATENKQKAKFSASKSRTTITRHQDDKLCKAALASSLFPINMIAKLGWTSSNVHQNIEQLQTPTMGVKLNQKSTTTEPPPQNRQQPKPPGGLNTFYWYQTSALDSAVAEVQEMFSLHGSLLTKLNAMYYQGETL